MSAFSRRLLLASGVVATATVLYFSARSAPPHPIRPPVTDARPVAPAPRAPTERLQALAAGFSSASGQANGEAGEISGPVVTEQINLAGKELQSPDAEMRIGALQQLAAYPNKESEGILLRTLQTDPDESVRSAAAEALSSVSKPGKSTVSAVVAASADPSGRVRTHALMTLEVWVEREAYGSARTKAILEQLRQRLKRRLKASTRADIRDFLADHAS